MLELTCIALVCTSVLCVRWYRRVRWLEAYLHYQARLYLELLEVVSELDATYEATSDLLEQSMALSEAHALVARAIKLKEH